MTASRRWPDNRGLSRRTRSVWFGLLSLTTALVLGTVGVWWTARAPRLPVLQVAGDRVPQSAWSLRVALTPSPQVRLTLTIDSAWEARLPGDGRLLGNGRALNGAVVTATKTGIRVGDRVFPTTRLELVPDRSPAIWVDDHQYRGRLRILRQRGGRLLAVNVVDLEQYVASVVDSEMPAKFARAARQAQAIVARTYALKQQQTFGRHHAFDVYATTRSQKYLGFQYLSQGGRRLAGESDASRRIARETQGIVCLNNGHLLSAYYSAVCGGRTTPGAELFADASTIPSVVCNWCQDAALYRWERDLDAATMHRALERLLRARGASVGVVRSVVSHPQPRAGELPRFDIRGDETSVTLNGSELRAALSDASLPSPHFTLVRESDRYVFAGRGYGHGVGLCQWGASGQGNAGRSCLQILRHYYPQARIVILESR